MITLAAVVVGLLLLFLWWRLRKRPQRCVLGDGFSVRFSAFWRDQAVVDYREGNHELSWYGELGRTKDGRDSLLVWIPESPAFVRLLPAPEAASMVNGKMTLLWLPRIISPAPKLTEVRVTEIKGRISKALDQMGIPHDFCREGWTSFDSKGDVVERNSALADQP